MKFFTVAALSNFIGSKRAKSFHCDMFHGIAGRDGKEWPHDPKVWANMAVATPLEIVRTGSDVPALFRPASHLVISEHLKAKLPASPNVRLMRVVFKKLVEYRFRDADGSFLSPPIGIEASELLHQLSDVPSYHAAVGAYYEVQTCRLVDIIGNYPDARTMKVEYGTPPFVERKTTRLSERLLRDYPIIRHADIIMNEDVYNILNAYFDKDFFLCRAYEVKK
jgi:hypothetical protein